jgi:hypothetical protein
MSAPHLASAEAGRRLLDAFVARLEGPVLDALEGRGGALPLPMAWARSATLEGRLLRWLPV